MRTPGIHLIHPGVIRLLKHFLHAGINRSEVDEYNCQSKTEWEHMRDFIIPHYQLNGRADSQVWRECHRYRQIGRIADLHDRRSPRSGRAQGCAR